MQLHLLITFIVELLDSLEQSGYEARYLVTILRVNKSRIELIYDSLTLLSGFRVSQINVIIVFHYTSDSVIKQCSRRI